MAVAEQIDLMQEGVLAGVPLPYIVRLSAPMSDEELMAFSRKNQPYQIECNSEGELEIMSPPGAQGSHWEAIAISELGHWTRSNGGVFFSSNGGFRLPNGSVRSPDAAWISQERWDGLSSAERSRFAPLCPDFVVEILSATDSRKRLREKMEMWIANGAQLAWMIDPYAATLSIYRPGAQLEVLDRPDSVEAGEPVAGFRLSTLLLWDQDSSPAQG